MTEKIVADGKQRNSSIDLQRILAFFFVVCLHSILNIGFTACINRGKTMLVLNILYVLFYSCVGLFIMMTGFLQTKKTVSVKYYTGVIRTLVLYVMCSAVCMTYKVIEYDYPLTFKEWSTRILGFTASDYAWYMEMYLGLFLMIPFLNAAYHGMKTHKRKLVLICSMLFITALPGVLNTFNLTTPGWWSDPASSTSYTKLIPGWWTGMYPLTYYFIGCYLKEFPLRIKKRYLTLMLAFFVLAAGIYNYYRMHGTKFFYGSFMTNASIFITAIGVMVFSLTVSFDLTRIPILLKRAMSHMAKWTFGAYLVSAAVDIYAYSKLKAAVPEVFDRIIYLPVTVIFVFTVSLAVSGVLNGIYDGVRLLGEHLWHKFRSKKDQSKSV